MSIYSYQEGVLRDFWDDATRTFTHYDETGAVVYTRSYDEGENDAADKADVQRTANRAQVESRLRASLALNLDYLALNPPTQADVLAQVNRLTREVSGLIRLRLRELGSIDE